MSRITYFAVLPLSRDADGDFLAEAAIDVRSAAEPRATAVRVVEDRGLLNLMVSLVTLALSMLVRSRAVS
jgi:hypothetical protein